MENEDIWKILGVFAVGLLLGAALLAISTPECEECEECEVCEDCEICEDCPTEEELCDTATETTVEVEVEKDFNDYKDEAIDKCIAELKEDLDLDEYQKVTIREVSDDWDIEFFTVNNVLTDFKDEDRIQVTVDEVELRYIDTLTDNRINKEMWCEVIYRGDRGELVDYTIN